MYVGIVEIGSLVFSRLNRLITFIPLFYLVSIIFRWHGILHRRECKKIGKNKQRTLKVGSCPDDDNSVQFYFLSFSVWYLNNFIF